MNRLATAALAACAAALLAPAAAHAASASVVDGVVRVDAAPGEANDLSIWPESTLVRITDWGNVVVAGPGCTAESSRTVSCALAGRVRVELGDGDDFAQLGGDRGSVSWEAHGGDGDDYLNGGAGPVTGYGGAGDDQLFSGGHDDLLHGGPGQDDFRAGAGDDVVHGDEGIDIAWGEEGADRLDGGADLDELFGHDSWGSSPDDGSADVLSGGPGPDYLDGEAGPDRMAGGDGGDVVRYLSHSAPLTVTLDGTGPDGADGENDAIDADVEAVQGGSGDDRLAGGGGPDGLYGGPGADVLDGGDGGDWLLGEAGADELLAGDGDDGLRGGLDSDRLVAGAGVDELDAGEGDDRVEARGAPADAEAVECGAGAADVAVLDAADRPARCERREWPDRVEEDPPPVPVVGSWSPAVPVSAEGAGSWGSGVVVTAAGETVASWSESAPGSWSLPVRAVVKPRGGPAGEPFTLDPEGSGGGAQLAAGPDGEVLALWVAASGAVRVAERPPGGEFGPPEPVGTAGYGPVLSVNRAGDAAAIWYEWRERRWLARVRPSGGSWGAAVAVSGELPPGDPWGWRAILTDGGDLVALWQHELEGVPAPALVAVRDRDGTVLPVRQLSEPGQWGGWLDLGAARDGTVVAAWNESSYGRAYAERVRLATRRPGQVFGAAATVPGGHEHAGPPALGVAADGRVTLAFTQACDGQLVAGPSAAELAPVRRFELWHCNGDVSLAQDASGVAMVGWQADSEHAVTVTRDASGALSPPQDLRPGCEHAQHRRLAIEATGLGAALIADGGRQLLAAHEPFAGDGHQACLDSSLYGEAPASEPPPAPPYPGGAPAPPPGEPARPNATPPLGAAASSGEQPQLLRVGSLGVRVLRGRPLATLVVRCSSRCAASVSAALGPRRGRALALGRRRVRSVRGTLRVRVPLRGVRGVRAGRRPLVLRVRVRVEFAEGAVAARRATRRLPPRAARRVARLAARR